MIPESETLTYEEVVACSSRAFFKVGSEIVTIENVGKHKEVAEALFDLLAIPGVYMDRDLLQKVFDTSSGAALMDLAREKSVKPSRLASKMIEKIDPRQSRIKAFLNTNLGVSILKDLINLPAMAGRKPQSVADCREVMEQIENSLLESPISCLKVKDVKAVCDDKGRVKGKFVFDDGEERNTVFAMGQMYSGYCSTTGDLYLNAEEYESRKRKIEAGWEVKNKQVKWYKKYGGTDSASRASLSMTLRDAQSCISTYSTVTALKKNFILLAFLCRTTETMDYDDMCDAIISALYNEQSNFPLRYSRGFYLKVKECLTVPSTFYVAEDGQQALKRLKADSGKAVAVTSVANRKFANIVMTNSESEFALSEPVRNVLSMKETGSAILISITLGSYKDESGTTFYTAGIARNLNHQLPVVVGKASVLFGEKVEEKETKPQYFYPADGGQRDIQKVADKVKRLLEEKRCATFEDACIRLDVPDELKTELEAKVGLKE